MHLLRRFERACLRPAAFGLMLLVCLLGAASLARATTAFLPPDDDLIIGARAIITGKVTAIECGIDDQQGRIFTYVTIRVHESLKGDIENRFITIKQAGGQFGAIGEIIFGSPRFRLDEEVLLYLDTWNDGSLRVHQMFLGKFTVADDARSNRRVVIRDFPDTGVSVINAPDALQSQSPVTNRMELEAYTAMIEERLRVNRERAYEFEQTYYRNQKLLASPPEYQRSTGKQFQPQFTFLFNPPARWFEPDNGQPVVFKVNTAGMPNAQMIDDINAAMNAWSTVPGCSMRVTNGGTTTECRQPDVNNFIFNDCDQMFAPTPGCSSILALGGLSYDSRQSRTVNGKVFYQGESGHVSFNPYASCFFQDHCNFREIVTHELGHALGLGHSAQFDATMAATAHFDGRCASVKQDDIDGIRFIYPPLGGGPGPLTIVNDSPLTTGLAQRAYSQQMIASGGTVPYTWSLATGGQLPPGLSLGVDGLIGGTPMTTGSYAFVIQVKDSQNVTAQKPFTISVTSAETQYDSQFISQTVPATVKPSETFSFSVKWLNTGTKSWDGANGFVIRSQNPESNKTWGGDTVPLYFFNVPSGQQLDVTITAFAPREPGTYNFQWQLFQEGVGVFGQKSENVSITVSDGSALIITNSLPMEGAQGQPMNYQLTASGGTPTYTWSVASGVLPSGLALNASTGMISGTPAGAGSGTITIQVSDSGSHTAQKSLAINIAPPPVEVMTATLAQSQKGSAYLQQLVATGGKPPYTWSVVSEALPPGLALASATGIISGTPTAAGNFSFAVEAKDSESRAGRKTLTITVVPPISLELATLVEAIKGTSFSYQPGASGGTPPLTWSVTTGALPAGLALNAGTGVISGTPTGAGLFNIGITVRDQSNGSANGSFQIKVIDPETIPAITKAKYKASKGKLTVTGDRINPSAVLVVDGNQLSASPADGAFVVKRMALQTGQHQIIIINPGGIRSQPYALTID